MADSFLGVLRHQGLQLSFGPLMIQKRLPCAAEQAGKFRPRIGSTPTDDPPRLDPWFRRLDTEEARGLAALNAPPELSLGRDDEVLIERIGMGGDLDPLAAARDHGEDSTSGRN